MPDYRAPRYGISLSEALHEAAVVAPITRVMLNTFELWHISFPDGAIYVVNDHEDLLATKEATAARDPGVEVTFVKAYILINEPDEGDKAGTPEISLTVGDVSGVFTAAVRAARGSRIPWELIERVYASDETDGPAINPPTKMFLTNVTYDPQQATFKASFGDSVNTSVPRTTFRRAQYPALVR